MTLNLIGIGLNNEKDITLKGLELVKASDLVYLENYTSKLQCSAEDLEKLYEKKLILANRKDVEGDDNQILKNAKTKNVSLLIIGDVFSATTHVDLFLRAKKEKIKVNVVNNTSILNAVGIVGLQLYKYGKTTSISFPEPNFKPETPYEVIAENKKSGFHTLLLLDLKPLEEKYMTVNFAIEYLLEIGKKRGDNIFNENTFCVGCARLGSNKPTIVYGKAKELLKKDFGKPPHCLIVPGNLHFMEEEVLNMYK